MFLNGDRGSVAERPDVSEDDAVDAIISAVVASSGARELDVALLPLPLSVGYCLAR